MSLFSSFPRHLGSALYVDVGGTSIRAGSFPSWTVPAFIRHLEKNPGKELNRVSWDPRIDGCRIGDIVRSLVSSASEVERAVLAIPGREVSSNGRKYRGWLTRNGVNIELASHIEHALQLNEGAVTLLHDSKAWAQGVRALMKYRRRSIPGGLGLIVVGTGVAFAVVTEAGITAREVDSDCYDWTALNVLAERNAGIRAAHDHVGKMYFEWRKTQNWNEQARRTNAKERLQCVLDELSMKHHLSKFLIGGGYVEEFEKGRYSVEVEFLTRPSLGFDPGFLPLIGLCA